MQTRLSVEAEIKQITAGEETLEWTHNRLSEVSNAKVWYTCQLYLRAEKRVTVNAVGIKPVLKH